MNKKELNESLIVFSESGNLEMVKQLVESGANVRFDDSEALCSAANYGHLDVVKYLVEHGSSVYTTYNSPINLAAGMDYMEVVHYLAKFYHPSHPVHKWILNKCVIG